MKKSALIGTCAAALAFATAADAAPIKNAVSIVIDGSVSISSGDFATQVNAYATLFGDAGILPADGSVVINVVQFSSQGTGQIEQTAFRINDETDRATLVASVNAMSQLNGLTDIQEGIALGVANMEAFLGGLDPTDFDVDFSKLVDVSTDGGHNQPGDPAAEAQNAVNLGYAEINCLGIGASADCSFNDPDLGLDFNADSFAELEAVLEQKLRREFDTVPAPASLLLLGVGLAGLGLASRRKA